MMTNSVSLRLAAVRELLPAHEIDALLVSGPENRRYVSGFTASDPAWGMVLITAEAALLLTDFRYQEWARQEAQECEVCIHKVDLADTLGEHLKKLEVRRLGFEAVHLTYRQHQRLTQAVADAGLEVAWQPLEGLVEGLRQIKTGAELAVMRRALTLTETVMRQVADRTRPGPDRAPGGLGDRKAPPGRRGRGHGLSPHRGGRTQQRPAPSPPRGLCPQAWRAHHHRHGGQNRRLLRDMTRTFIIGPADEHFRKIYSLVRQAQARAEAGLKAGMDSLVGDALAREVIAAAGFGEAFGHSLGHGVGLAVHETPNLSPSEARRGVLPAGCVLTVEPGIYLTGWGGVRLEDMVLLHPEGAEVLNQPGYFYEWD